MLLSGAGGVRVLIINGRSFRFAIYFLQILLIISASKWTKVPARRQGVIGLLWGLRRPFIFVRIMNYNYFLT